MLLGTKYCETPCKEGFKKDFDNCINEKNKENKYKRKITPISIADPLCVNGYFFQGYCNSSMSHTDYSNENFLSPCEKGAILESFCAYSNYSNKKLSQINNFLADFIRKFYDELFSLFSKKGPLSRKAYAKAKNLKEISRIFEEKKHKKICVN